MRLIAIALTSLAATGCLRLELMNYAVRKPGNVAVYFTVDRYNHDPVPGLTADKFNIYEDGKPISVLESRQTIINPEVAAVHYTLLLMDMSGSVVQSGQVPALQAAAQAFTARVEKYQKVGIYAFDGEARLHPIVPFTGSSGSASSGVGALGRFSPRDPSTNLHGAVVEALATLDKALASASQPLKFGTLVVFTDGTDRANRLSRDDMMRAVRQSPHDIFVVGVGAEIDKGELRALGRTGAALESDPGAVQRAFEQVAQRIEGYTQRFYLLSYCSPARRGERALRIEAVAPDGQKGSLEAKFNSDGFTPNCDPNTPPPFDTSLRGRRNLARPGQ